MPVAAPLPEQGSFLVPASPRCCHTGGVPAAVSTDFTNATPVITETYIAEVLVPVKARVSGIAVLNGTDVTGNTAVALTDREGVVLANSAAVAGSGTDAYQRIPFSAPITVDPGTYYVLRQQSSATARINNHAIGNFGAGKKTAEVFGTFTTITPPTTFTADLGPVATLY